MPAQVLKPGPRPQGPPTSEMVRALEALGRQRMERFRVGYAHDCRGPFWRHGTIDGLWRRGLVDFTERCRNAVITRAGRAWLADNKQTNVEAA